MSSDPDSLREAKSTLARKGRSFHWAKRLLSQQHGDRAARLYAFCRHLDDLADEPGSPSAASDQLRSARSELETGRSEHPAMLDMLRLIDECQIDPRIPSEMILGLLSDLEEVRYETIDALLRYSYRVAGTVGLMMCDVLDVDDPAAAAFAIDLGIAMQLTNICRDVREDACAHRRYLPSELIGEIATSDLIEPPALRQLALTTAVARLLDLADAYYRSGESGLPYLPVRARHGILIASRVYAGIGGRLRAQGCRYWERRAVVSSGGKLSITLASLTGSFFSPGFWTKPRMHDSSLHQALKGLPYAHSPHVGPR